jgi:hypothetical protein
MNDTTPSKRPSLVTWLGIGVLLLSAANFLTAISTLMRREILEGLTLSIPFSMLVGLHVVWGILWLIIVWGWWRLKAWARLALPLAFLLYEVTIIGQQMIFARQAYARGRLPFALATAALGIAIIIWIVTRPRVRQIFDSVETRTTHFAPGSDGDNSSGS